MTATAQTSRYLSAREVAWDIYRRAVEMADTDYAAGRLSVDRWLVAREELAATLDDALTDARQLLNGGK